MPINSQLELSMIHISHTKFSRNYKQSMIAFKTFYWGGERSYTCHEAPPASFLLLINHRAFIIKRYKKNNTCCFTPMVNYATIFFSKSLLFI